jgi:hypothetical protein
MNRTAFRAGCLVTVACVAPACVSAQEISDEWQFGATLYGWLPDIAGNATFPSGAGTDINVDVSTILDHLKMTAQGSFALQKGRWGGFTDIVYLDVGDSMSRTRGLTIGDQPLPGSIEASTNFDLKSTIWTFAGSYRAMANSDSTFDWLAGARLANFKQTFKWEFTGDFGPIAPPPLTGSRSSSVDQWDAIVGFKGSVTFGADHNWVMPYYFDVGAGDSDMTWQAMVGLGYAFSWGELGVAWRYLDYDLKSGRPVRDLNLNGPGIGATFRW